MVTVTIQPLTTTTSPHPALVTVAVTMATTTVAVTPPSSAHIRPAYATSATRTTTVMTAFGVQAGRLRGLAGQLHHNLLGIVGVRPGTRYVTP